MSCTNGEDSLLCSHKQTVSRNSTLEHFQTSANEMTAWSRHQYSSLHQDLDTWTMLIKSILRSSSIPVSVRRTPLTRFSIPQIWRAQMSSAPKLEHIEIQTEDGIAVLKYHRPKNGNALHTPLLKVCSSFHCLLRLTKSGSSLRHQMGGTRLINQSHHHNRQWKALHSWSWPSGSNKSRSKSNHLRWIHQHTQPNSRITHQYEQNCHLSSKWSSSRLGNFLSSTLGSCLFCSGRRFLHSIRSMGIMCWRMFQFHIQIDYG